MTRGGGKRRHLSAALRAVYSNASVSERVASDACPSFGIRMVATLGDVARYSVTPGDVTYTMARSSSSEMVGMPNSRALSSLLPAFSPSTT